jgi:hypothetical protein
LATLTPVVTVLPAGSVAGVTVTEPPVEVRAFEVTSAPLPVISMVWVGACGTGVLEALMVPAPGDQNAAPVGAEAFSFTGSDTLTLPLPGTVTPEQMMKSLSEVEQVPPPVTVGVSSWYTAGGFGILMVVFGAPASPVFVTVTVGVPFWPGASATGETVIAPSLMVPEQIASATTTEPLATTPRPPWSSPMSRARTV